MATPNQNLNPILLFHEYHALEKKLNNQKLPDACCFSTIGLDGYPNSRFVSLKEVINDRFIITGSLSSRKGLELRQEKRAALSFWWTATEKQVRIQGNVTLLTNHQADVYFQQRNRESQLVAVASKQGEQLEDLKILDKNYNEAEQLFHGKSVDRPVDWGVFSLEPIRIEFLTFQQTRFHQRTLFEKKNQRWQAIELQP